MKAQVHPGEAWPLAWLHWALGPVRRLYGRLLQASLLRQHRHAPLEEV